MSGEAVADVLGLAVYAWALWMAAALIGLAARLVLRLLRRGGR